MSMKRLVDFFKKKPVEAEPFSFHPAWKQVFATAQRAKRPS